MMLDAVASGKDDPPDVCGRCPAGPRQMLPDSVSFHDCTLLATVIHPTKILLLLNLLSVQGHPLGILVKRIGYRPKVWRLMLMMLGGWAMSGREPAI